MAAIEVETHPVAGRRRWLRLLLAGAAETFFFVGLLAAVGFVAVGLALLLLTLAAATVIAAALLLKRRPGVRRPRAVQLRRLRSPVCVQRPAAVVARTAAAIGRAERATAARLQPVLRRAGAAVVAGMRKGGAKVGPASAKLRESSVSASKRVAQRAQELHASPPSAERLLGAVHAAKGRALAAPDVHPRFQEQEAVRLNADGSRLRRAGDPVGAAEQHRAALHFYRALGDRRAEALTLNNIALALSTAGDDDAALEHFDAAVEILRDLGDRHHEGQVLANLGAAHLRHGRGDDAQRLLQTALEKLEPASPAARLVEEELRRAS